jgi:hypothetical protein
MGAKAGAGAGTGAAIGAPAGGGCRIGENGKECLVREKKQNKQRAKGESFAKNIPAMASLNSLSI